MDAQHHPEHHLIYRPEVEGTGDHRVDRILTIPNVITFGRMMCIPYFLWLLFGADSPGWAGFLLGVLGCTDWVDGYVARRFDMGSNFGKMFDPIVDRLMLVVSIVAILIHGAAPLWYCWLVLVREAVLSTYVVVITAMGAKRMDVTWWGKVGAFANMGAFPSFLIADQRSLGEGWHLGWTIWAWILLVPGVVFSLWSAGQYLVRGRAALAEGRAERAAQERAAGEQAAGDQAAGEGATPEGSDR